MKFRPSYFAWTVCVIGILLILFGFANKNTADNQAIAVSGAVGGPFTLVDQNGKKVTEKSWPDKYLLVYFGFTHCPDVCPTGLSKLAAALNALPKETVAHIQPIFITIDPERDTADSLKQYMPLFHPKMVGLTGSRPEIDNVIKSFKVYAQKEGTGKDYMVNHSAFTYLLNPDGVLVGLYSHEITSNDMANKIKQAVK